MTPSLPSLYEDEVSESKIARAFSEFHHANPDVYKNLVLLARKAKGQGKTAIGMKMLYEVVRWHFFLITVGDDDFKLNNNYTSHYSRLIMKQEPDLVGIFNLRELRS